MTILKKRLAVLDGGTSWSRSISDQRYSSPALTAMPVPQVGWCRILLRS
jgi:hypothetical protein